MDSGNSGSMQSSSGGDEDQCNGSSSRANQSLTSQFLMPNNLSNSYFNFNMSPQSHPLSQFPDLTKSCPTANLSRPYPENNLDPTAGNTLMITKNPKKRTRASRRAPTTVLTTDTSNFRAMVQEFTGIPASPFSATGSPFSSRRFDIFRSSSSSSPGTMVHHNNNPIYNPIFGPHTQKVQISSSSSILDHQITVDSSNISSVPMNYHFMPDLPLPRPPSNNNFVQNPNPNLSFQSLLTDQHPSIQYGVGGIRQDRQEEHSRNHLNISSEEFDRQNINNGSSSSRAVTEGTSFGSWICPAD